MDLVAISNGDVILLIALAAIPVVAFSFLFAGNALKQIGKGPLSIDDEFPHAARGSGGGPAPVSAEQREAEIRQFLEGKAYRQQTRGEKPLDVDAELARLLEDEPPATAGTVASDTQLVAEIRELVVARNERRVRMGREPLDVEEEVQRQITEMENLGQ